MLVFSFLLCIIFFSKFLLYNPSNCFHQPPKNQDSKYETRDKPIKVDSSDASRFYLTPMNLVEFKGYQIGGLFARMFQLFGLRHICSRQVACGGKRQLT
jgi:hypothetical protein